MNTNIRKELGKIGKVYFGHGGYQEAMIGISFTLELNGGASGVGDFWGDWNFKRDPGCKWTEQQRIDSLGNCYED
jgi:hypothetical protein